MKKLLIVIFFHVVWIGTKAQSLQSKVINSGGNTHSSSGVTLIYSIGEFSIATFSKPGNGSIQSGFLHGLGDMNLLKAEKDSTKTDIALQKTSVVTVYPNPASNNAVIQFHTSKTTKYQLKLTDISGKVLQTKTGVTNNGENKIMLNVSKYAQGIYLINLTDEEHGKRMLKLNKQ
jgi:hypothetical protein